MRKRGIRLNKISYKKIIYTQQQLSERIAELGKQITADYEGQEIVLLGVLKGSLFFCTDLARAIDQQNALRAGLQVLLDQVCDFSFQHDDSPHENFSIII